MFHSRILVVLGVCFLAASAAWADDVGYVDCTSHSEGTQVFGKPRKTPDVVASVACGERFTILVYGFYFSRIQTKDGQVGYVYSNLIAVDHGATSVQQAPPQAPPAPAQPAVQQVPSLQMASEKTKIPHTPPIDAEPAPAAPATPQPEAAPARPTTAQPDVTPTPGSAPAAATTAPSAAENSTTSGVATTPAPPNVTETPASGGTTSAASAPASAAAPSAAASAQPDSTATAQPQPDAAGTANMAQPAGSATAPAATDATTSAAKQPEVGTTATEATQPAPTPAQPETAAQPDTTSAAAQPEPAPAEPAAPIKPGDKIDTWEKPRPTARTAPLVELYGGYAFARMGGAGSSANLNGALGSFGWNPNSWLQVVADTSYSFQTVGNTKNTLYGNHFGPRFFRRTRFRWGFTPFAEAFVGGSSEKTTISGSGGSTSSTGSAISYKVGGGIDIHPSRHWDVRLFDFDYYRTSFGSGTQQNNYWISTGVVLRLFGGRNE